MVPALRTLYIIAFVFVCFAARTQNVIQAPALQCVKNDTVFWSLPVNSCGPFASYLLFGSTNFSGPFNLIAAITNPLQTTYFHDTPGAQVWYYYMQSSHNCPGFIRLSSDTLSSAPPPKVPLTSASVINGQVHLTWPPNASPQVDRYIIYRNTPNGTIPIDTVFNDTTYIDVAANPAIRSEIYYIVASDPCGNNSLFDILHQTIFLSATTDICAQTVTLAWSPYINWPGGVDSQVIWLGIDGNAPTPIEKIDGQQTTVTYAGVDDQTTYCFTVQAVEGMTGVTAMSNEICLNPDIVQPPRQMQIKYITINAAQEPELEWIWETYAELELAGIERSLAGAPFQPIQPVAITAPLSAVNNFTDAGLDASLQQVSYQIMARDDCQKDWLSKPASPVWLQAVAYPDFRNVLTWTPLVIENGVIEQYDVFEQRGSLILPLGQTMGTTFEHVLDGSNLPLEPVCYVVEATYRVTLPNGQERRISRSNRACASQEIRIWMPNAFAPRGLNSIFRPLLVFAENTAYEFIIFDRWGGEVFRTTDQQDGWNGKINGSDAAPGIYVWSLQVTPLNGESISSKGTVMLLR